MAEASHHQIRETREGGGIVLTCPCGWGKWTAARRAADKGRRDHAKSCKVARGEVSA